VTAALLSAALAVLLWPDHRAQRWRRAARLGRSARPRILRLPATDELPAPLVLAIAVAGVAAVLSTALVALLAGILALVGARSWAGARRERAEEGWLAGLEEGLGALAAELRSGRALEPATDAAVDACGTQESGRVLARAVRSPEPGSRPPGAPGGRDDAVSSAGDRLSAAVLLSTRTGCSLADVVAAVDEDLRARRRHRQELRSAVAAPRASAALLAGLPLLGLAMGSGIGADPWRVLTATGTGQVLLVTGVALELAGLAWSRRLAERALR
jgi:tight adherence protein B